MKGKILVVDDEPDLEVLIRQKFRRKIREGDYEFIFAVNGKHALQQLIEHTDTDIVLSDINMPEMDGLTLLTKLAEQNSLLKSVIVSAYGDMENIRIAMNRGAFDFVTKPVNFEDLETTIEKTLSHVLQMRKTLAAVKENNILRMYVDETVLNFMGTHNFEASLSISETVEATVAFIDICEFTRFSESAHPAKVVELLNSYFDLMAKEIIAQEGMIDKFIGDAVMAVFRGDYHLDRAVDACLAIRNKIDALPSQADGFKARITVGINSGEMIAGNIGSGSLRRLDYTVIGDTVNLAQRMQAFASPGQIIISEASYEKIKEAFQCRMIAEAKLKNKAESVVLYEVLE